MRTGLVIDAHYVVVYYRWKPVRSSALSLHANQHRLLSYVGKALICVRQWCQMYATSVVPTSLVQCCHEVLTPTLLSIEFNTQSLCRWLESICYADFRMTAWLSGILVQKNWLCSLNKIFLFSLKIVYSAGGLLTNLNLIQQENFLFNALKPRLGCDFK